MRRLILLAAALLLVAGTQYALQLAPGAVITIEAWSPRQLHDAGLTTQQSGGLRVVGLGSLVYLRGSEAGGEEILSYQWTAKSPSGTVIPTDSLGTERTTFRPNQVGTWIVGLTITTASGTGTTSTTIVAGKYAGVGNLGGAISDAGKGQCAACHPHNTSAWMGTSHASKFTRAIDGIDHSSYRESCIECHTVGYDESAVNGGFDDVASLLDWTFPAAIQPGNWQNILSNYKPLAQLANIQCENCHGPGSEHKGNKANIDISVEAGVCAQCHEEEPYHVRPIMWRNSKHATGNFSRGTRSTCATCHSTYGFIARIDIQSNLDQQVGKGEGVTCAACHDPHESGDDHPHQLRTVDDVTLVDGTVVTWGGHGRLCMNCHQARRTAYTQVIVENSYRLDPHYSNQSDMFAANNVAQTFGRYIPSSTHRDALEDTCVSCHMYETPAAGEPGHFFVGDHTFAVRAEVDGELVENVAVCERCHGVLESFSSLKARVDHDGDGTVEGVRDELYGVEENLAMLLPPVGSPEVDDSRTTIETEYNLMQRWALFNLNFVKDDGSEGIHNFQFAIGLLKVSIEAVKFGVVSPGMITAIADVPNDQGKAVRVTWERFGGDGVSTDPIARYIVLRNDGLPGVGKAPLPNVEDLDLEATTDGTRMMLGGEGWTQVGSADAFQADEYSLVVPTLFDGEETEFMVVAKTASSMYSVVSLPAVGMSEDNLIPTSPMGLVAQAGPEGVTLRWQALDLLHNPDVDYYAVYRGDTQGFVPGEPLATVTDPTFLDETVLRRSVYYYQVAAFDFSGNQGEFSGEIEAATYVGSEEMGLPTDYALHPNYPNPFNPSTTITFDVPAASELSIVVYDLLGRQVKTLVSGSVAAGRHETSFDATGLTSGLYIVRMRSGDRVFERSVVLMK